jgi:hypothetical protein
VDGLGGDDDAESGVFRVTLALIRVPVGLADVVGGEAWRSSIRTKGRSSAGSS